MVRLELRDCEGHHHDIGLAISGCSNREMLRAQVILGQ